MDLNFSDISVFAGDELVPVTVTLHDKDTPHEGVVYIKRLPSVDIDRFLIEGASADTEVRVNAIPRLLNKAVRKADGKAHFTAEMAGKLTNFNRSALFKAVMEVNKKADAEEAGNV